jgi:excisionase family DNA binding protein
MSNTTQHSNKQESAFSPKETQQAIALLYTRPEAAAKLAISLRTLDEQMAAGNLKFCRIGRSIRFRPSALEDFIAENETRFESKRRPARK